MIDFTPGQNAPIYLTLIDNGLPVTTATVTVTITAPDETALVTAAAATHTGSGVYLYTLTSTSTTQVGAYFVTWTVTGALTKVEKTTFTVGYETIPVYNRRELRQSILQELEGDFYLNGTVGSATSSTFVDTARIESDNSLRGNYVYLYAGTGSGQERRVIANTSADGSQTISPNWTVTPDATSLYEEHKFFSVAAVNQAIKDVVASHSNITYLPIQITQTFSSDTYRYDVPAGFSHIYAVHVQSSSGSDYWIPIVPGAWDVQRGLRKLVIDPSVINRYPNSDFIIFGLRPPALPVNDNSSIDLPVGFVRYKLASQLCRSKMGGKENDPYGWSDKFKYYEGLAKEARMRVHKGVPNNAKRLE
jgi:hypothetical protein